MLFTPNNSLSSPLTTKGDLWTYALSANQRLPIGADGLFLTADSSVTLGIKWASLAGAAVSVTSITSSVTLGSDVDYAFVSGGTFTITLPNPASFTIKPIQIQRTDDSISLPIYISGLINGTTNWAFYTVNETMKIMTNGSQWRMLDHYCRTDITAGVTTTITGSTSNPTKATTVQRDKISWFRDGKFAVVHFEYQQDAGTGGAAGSGLYLIALPNGLVADTTVVPEHTSTDAGTPAQGTLESCISADNGTTTYRWQAKLYNSTNVAFFGLNTGGNNTRWQSGTVPLNARIEVYGWFRVPIVGWKE